MFGYQQGYQLIIMWGNKDIKNTTTTRLDLFSWLLDTKISTNLYNKGSINIPTQHWFQLDNFCHMFKITIIIIIIIIIILKIN
jgi:hypothetical protein